jgi:EAL and modified HD-GYP domain-containing signal transduction protein
MKNTMNIRMDSRTAPIARSQSPINTSPQSTVFVGRQQIYDRDIKVVAYELLFRSCSENRAIIEDEDAATSQLLINALVEIGLRNLVFHHPALVKFTTNFILKKLDIPFDPKELIIEVQNNIKPDPEIIAALNDLRNAGYTIVLDGYVECDNRRELVSLVDIVKIDVRGFKGGKFVQEVEHLKSLSVKLMAEKIETIEDFEQCKNLGFHYFQGYFLSRPQVVEGTTIANNKYALLQLLVHLRNPSVSFDDIVELVKLDVSLSVKLLRFVNSVSLGLCRQIVSVRQAAVRLGLQQIHQIVSLIVTGEIADNNAPLMETTLVRAKMCEILGGPSRSENAENCFTIGILSSMDAFLNLPLLKILGDISVTDEMRAAILSYRGPMGRVLKTVVAFEQGRFVEVQKLGFEHTAVQQAYLSAVSWAQQNIIATAEADSM